MACCGLDCAKAVVLSGRSLPHSTRRPLNTTPALLNREKGRTELPVVLDHSSWAEWLDPRTRLEAGQSLLLPADEADFRA